MQDFAGKEEEEEGLLLEQALRMEDLLYALDETRPSVSADEQLKYKRM